MNEDIKSFLNKGLPSKDVEILLKLSKGKPDIFRRYAQRRLFGEPLAYITSYVSFCGRKFFVDRRVYIPNLETERMVKYLLGNIDKKSTIVDVGTGSGAIAITIKKEVPTAKVFAVDIDPAALFVAKNNAKKHGVNIFFKESYYVDDLCIKNPDFIISDLPYGDKRYTLDSINIKEFAHMPPISTFHPMGILKAYEELIQSIIRKKWKTKLLFESGLVEKQEIAKIIPNRLLWNYKSFKRYSITIVEF